MGMSEAMSSQTPEELIAPLPQMTIDELASYQDGKHDQVRVGKWAMCGRFTLRTV